jgi:hypothetical protein
MSGGVEVTAKIYAYSQYAHILDPDEPNVFAYI